MLRKLRFQRRSRSKFRKKSKCSSNKPFSTHFKSIRTKMSEYFYFEICVSTKSSKIFTPLNHGFVSIWSISSDRRRLFRKTFFKEKNGKLQEILYLKFFNWYLNCIYGKTHWPHASCLPKIVEKKTSLYQVLSQVIRKNPSESSHFLNRQTLTQETKSILLFQSLFSANLRNVNFFLFWRGIVILIANMMLIIIAVILSRHHNYWRNN